MLKIENKVLMNYYFPCRSERRRCKLEHILNWSKVFIDKMDNNRGMLNERSQYQIILIHIKVNAHEISNCKGLALINNIL